MNREWVTLAFGILLVSAVAMVSVWQNYPVQETAAEAAAAAPAPAETPAKTPAEAPVQRPAASAAAPTPVSYRGAATTPATPPPARVDARLPVLHKHRFGDCQGTLRAVPGTLTYATSHKEDAFRVAFAEVEAFELDADKKNLRIRSRGGKTWNFTTRDETGAALTAFHKEAARLRR
jgi:hypothetical protein